MIQWKGLAVTTLMTSSEKTNTGAAYLWLNYILRVVYLIPMLMLWRTLLVDGVDVGMSLGQMLTYTYLGTIFADILVVQTPGSHWLYEGLIIRLYQRPLSVLLHLAAQTVGQWIPVTLWFSLPMLLLAPLLGVDVRPPMEGSWLALVSLVLCIGLGFAVDFLFSCVTIRMQNAAWLVHSLRSALLVFFAGRVIPFAVFPWGLGELFQYLPLGSLAGAPLAIYTGLAPAGPLILAQVGWNIVLWPLALWVWQASQERMVSYGG